jgi:mono/diheme cytochrome c family protein
MATLSLIAPPWCSSVEPTAPNYVAGATAFQANCAVCHGRDGAGTPSLAPPLSSYPARYAASPEGRRQLAITVLYGMFGEVVVDQKHYNFKMPDFTRLDDSALAAVLNFVIFDLAHAPESTQPLTSEEIAAERRQPMDGAAVRERRVSVLAALGL